LVFVAVGEGFFFIDARCGDGGVAALAAVVWGLLLVVGWRGGLGDAVWEEEGWCARYFCTRVCCSSIGCMG
jgi:hypothetical protein